MSTQLDEILEKNLVQTLFQPIVALKTGSIFGYEALTRGPEGALHAPLALFSEAKRYNRLPELDRLCRDTILHCAREQHAEGLLFINIDPAALFDRFTKAEDILHTREESYPADRIVLEFTMEEDICKFGSFIDLVQQLKKAGFHIACDNTVPGSTELLSVHNLHPDYIKISLLETGGSYQSACALAQMTHAQVIAVGVHTAEQLRALAESGIAYAQGNFLSPPETMCPTLRDTARILLEQAAAPHCEISDT
ncbi:MAG: EAL domain-containing protein [Ethanoligenens sp.]